MIILGQVYGMGPEANLTKVGWCNTILEGVVITHVF